MSEHGQEIEVKFYIRDLKKVEAHLQELGARFVQARVLERNIRFDLPGARLRAEGRVLRLRQDTEAKLTYKGAGKQQQGILDREEIEFTVGDFEKAKRFLEALGYQKLVYYEKYRTTCEWNGALIMLDEMPYGSFLEIEGQDHESIRGLADRLGLNWETAVATSYIALFDRVCKVRQLSCEDLSFANFAGMNVTDADLGVRAADR